MLQYEVALDYCMIKHFREPLRLTLSHRNQGQLTDTDFRFVRVCQLNMFPISACVIQSPMIAVYVYTEIHHNLVEKTTYVAQLTTEYTGINVCKKVSLRGGFHSIGS